MIIDLATSKILQPMKYNEVIIYLFNLRNWCTTNLGEHGDRWQIIFSPADGERYNALPTELIIPDEEDAMMVKLKFGL